MLSSAKIMYVSSITGPGSRKTKTGFRHPGYAFMDDERPAERQLMIYRIDENRQKQVYLIRTQATVIIQFNHYLGG